jgi:hypothetical protein
MDGYFPDPVRVVVHGRGASRTEAVPGVVGLATDHSYIRLDQFGWVETEDMGQVEAARAVEPSTGRPVCLARQVRSWFQAVEAIANGSLAK